MSDRARMFAIMVITIILGLTIALAGCGRSWGNTSKGVTGSAGPVENPADVHQVRLVTANIGRGKPHRYRAQAIRRTPLGITGWQEINPRERRAIRQARPRHRMVCPRTRVPITVPPAQHVVGKRVTRLHGGVARVSKPRVVCEARLASRTVVLNTHFIQGAHSRPHQRREATRQRLWNRSWRILRNRVQHHVERGRQVYVTGDLNNRRLGPIHPRGRQLIASGNDYIHAAPRVRVTDRQRVRLRIDGHRALKAVTR